MFANSGDTNQTPPSAAADLCLYSLNICPTKRTLGLYGLKWSHFRIEFNHDFRESTFLNKICHADVHTSRTGFFIT